MTEGAPRLSVVVATDDFATIRDLVDSFAAQTVASAIEVVVVCPSAAKLGAPAGPGPWAGFRVVEHALLPLGEARAAGVRAASAEVVLIAETHAFPAPHWAAHLARAHEGHWVAVMPGVANANPASAWSWAGFLVDYGDWALDRGPREIDNAPSYHASFKREALVAFGRRLGQLLEPGSTLARELREQGLRSWYEPAAQIRHLNVAQPRAWVHERYLGGRLLGASRRVRWSRRRTLVYLVASPLVPAIRLLRSRPALVSSSRAGHLPRGTTAATVLGCIAWGVGEAVGYAVGAGRATAARMLEYELHKVRYQHELDDPLGS